MRVKNISKQVLPILSNSKLVRLEPNQEADVVLSSQIMALVNSRLLDSVSEVLEVLDSREDTKDLDLLNSNYYDKDNKNFRLNKEDE